MKSIASYDNRCRVVDKRRRLGEAVGGIALVDIPFFFCLENMRAC